jgi:hypothetical protein
MQPVAFDAQALAEFFAKSEILPVWILFERIL